jgi:hypothetical protein
MEIMTFIVINAPTKKRRKEMAAGIYSVLSSGKYKNKKPTMDKFIFSSFPY